MWQGTGLTSDLDLEIVFVRPWVSSSRPFFVPVDEICLWLTGCLFFGIFGLAVLTVIVLRSLWDG